MRRMVISAAALLIAVTILGAASADARKGLTTGFADNIYQSSNPSVRNLWFDRTVRANAGIVRIDVNWREVVDSRPATPTSPADPAYHFSEIDAAVQSAAARGLRVVLLVTTAPGWAEGKNRPGHARAPAGTWKPDPAALGDFAQALATRYSGHFLSLPHVLYYEAWAEPNLSAQLTPQWIHKRAKSPRIYRRMLNAFYAGVKAAAPGDKVIGGGTAPFGDPPGEARMRPLPFLRKLFCLRRELKPTRCPSKPHLDVLAHNPISQFTSSGSPHAHATNPGNVAMADFHKVRAVLRAAERAKRVRPGGRHPLWATEIWWITDPYPADFAIPVRRQAYWIEEGFRVLWRQGARVVLNFEIRDGQPPTHLTTGIYFRDGKPKPAARSFRFPFVTHRHSGRGVSVWGKAPRSGPLKVQKRRNGHWRTLKRLKVKRGQVFTKRLRLHGAATLRGTVRGVTSLPWRQRK